jgi:hypothetical protein
MRRASARPRPAPPPERAGVGPEERLELALEVLGGHPFARVLRRPPVRPANGTPRSGPCRRPACGAPRSRARSGAHGNDPLGSTTVALPVIAHSVPAHLGMRGLERVGPYRVYADSGTPEQKWNREQVEPRVSDTGAAMRLAPHAHSRAGLPPSPWTVLAGRRGV